MVEYTVVEFTFGEIYRGGIFRGGIFRGGIYLEPIYTYMQIYRYVCLHFCLFMHIQIAYPTNIQTVVQPQQISFLPPIC